MDATGKAWVAGCTNGFLDGNTNAGGRDIFVMTFDRDGNHLWTRQRGGYDYDYAFALQVDWGLQGTKDLLYVVPKGGLCGCITSQVMPCYILIYLT